MSVNPWEEPVQECQTEEEASKWATLCQVYNYTDLLNMAFICNRDNWHTASFVILYLLVSVTAMVSNASVVLASIVERWKEIDQFTFVFAVSLSFNHFLVAFLVYPMGVYTMLRTDGWGLGNYWCTFTAYCTSYFEVLYMMHVLMIVFDMLIYRFTSLKEVVKVFLVKKVAMSLWVTALIPHLILLWNQSWFLTDGGSLGINEKYIKCNEKDSRENEVVINCFTAYTFTTYHELFIYLFCFFILPVAYAAISYTLLLYLRKRSMLKGNRKEELSEEEELENSRTFIQRYKASLCMVLVFSVTQLPKWITSFVLLGLDTAHRNAMENGDAVKEDNLQTTVSVIKMDFLSFWTCLGSILIPFCYMMTCPTYFHAVTATRPLFWLRKHGEVIHGRTYSRRLLERATRLLNSVNRNLRSARRPGALNPHSDTSPAHRLQDPDKISPTPCVTMTMDPSSPDAVRARLDTNSKIYMNSIAEECNGNTPRRAGGAALVDSGDEAKPSDEFIVNNGAGSCSASEVEVELPEGSEIGPMELSLSDTFPARPVRSYRDGLDISLEEKEATKRTLPVPRGSSRTSGATSPTSSRA